MVKERIIKISDKKPFKASIEPKERPSTKRLIRLLSIINKINDGQKISTDNLAEWYGVFQEINSEGS